MDSNNIIIGAISIALCLALFILVSYNRKKKEKKIVQSLINLANKQNCNISKHEICSDFIIGIDEIKKFVFFVKKMENQVIEQFINLTEIQNCKVKTTAKTVAFNKGTQNIIHKIELIFTAFDKNKKDATWEFFNDNINMQLNGEVQLAEKWSKLVNDLLKIKE